MSLSSKTRHEDDPGKCCGCGQNINIGEVFIELKHATGHIPLGLCMECAHQCGIRYFENEIANAAMGPDHGSRSPSGL